MANLFCYGRDRISGGEASRTKKRCLSKRICERVKETYTGEILPICPLVKEVVNMEKFPNIPNLPKTSSKISRAFRILEVFREIIARQQPTKEFITWCAHRNDVLQDCMSLIEKDLKLLPKWYERDYPQTNHKLEKLIKRLHANVSMYHSAHFRLVFMLPPIPDELLKDYRNVLAWQEEKENPDESLCIFLTTGEISGMASLICHYPAAAIQTMNRISNELFSLEQIEIEKAKHRKTTSQKPAVTGQGEKPDALLDSKILNLARRRIKAKFAERRKTLSEEVERIMGKLGFEGCARSSGAFKLVRDACDSEIDIKANIVWGSIQEVLNAVGSPLTNTLATALKQEVGYHIEAIVEEISKYMIQRLPMSKSNAHYFDFENIKREVKEKFDVEVDLYVDSLVSEPAGTGQKTKPDAKGFEQFTDEDQQLFHKIEINIKKNPDKYREAGKRLDEYYSESEYWSRREIELKICSAFTNPNAPGYRELAPEFVKDQEKRKNELELLLKKKDKPPLPLRLQDAWIGLEMNYVMATFLGENQAKVTLLIVWLLTDHDADRANFSLTQFQNWPWGFEIGTIGDFKEIRGGLAHDWWLSTERNWGVNKKYPDLWRKLIHAAWAKIEAEKEVKTDLAKKDANGLKKAERLAYNSYEYAISKKPELADETDDKVFDWLKENGTGEDNYELPSCDTWKRQVRQGRKVHGKQKNTLRAGRRGRSIIDSDQIQSLSEISNRYKSKAD